MIRSVLRRAVLHFLVRMELDKTNAHVHKVMIAFAQAGRTKSRKNEKKKKPPSVVSLVASTHQTRPRGTHRDCASSFLPPRRLGGGLYFRPRARIDALLRQPSRSRLAPARTQAILAASSFPTGKSVTSQLPVHVPICPDLPSALCSSPHDRSTCMRDLHVHLRLVEQGKGRREQASCLSYLLRDRRLWVITRHRIPEKFSFRVGVVRAFGQSGCPLPAV